jgi:hypothetical protein
MDKIPTYLEIKNQPTSKIFESEDIKGLTTKQVAEAEITYEKILDKLVNNEDLDEGFLSGLVGGGIGALAGPAIGKAICKALGIDEKGALGKLLTSRLVTTAIGYALGR